MPSNALPLTFSVAAIPAGNYTPQQLAAAIASRLVASTGESFAIFVMSTTEPASDVGPWLDPVNIVWKVWDDGTGNYQPIQIPAEAIQAGKLGTLGAIHLSRNGKRFDEQFPNVLFANSTFGAQISDPYTTGTGTGFSFTKPIPVRFVGPGHADAAGGLYPIICPDAEGFATILFSARIIGDVPDVDFLTVFVELNDSGVFAVLQAVASEDAGNQVGNGFRKLLINIADSVKFYCAPCNGSGDIPVSIACRVELDVLAVNG